MLTLEWAEIGGSEQRLLPVFFFKALEAFTDKEAILNRLAFLVLGKNQRFLS